MQKLNLENVIENYDGAFYVFDSKVLKERVKYLRNHMPANVNICYAVKANTFIIKEIEESIEKLEICSPGEYEICRLLNSSEKKMVISGVNKPQKFIESFAELDEFKGVLTAESLQQYVQISEAADKHKKKISVLLRLTNSSQFGMNENDIIGIMTAEQSEYVDIKGIQFFSGTQKTSIKKIKREIDKLDAFISKLRNEYKVKVKEFEYGTGFPVSYFDPEGFDEETYLKEFSEAIENMNEDIVLTFEIGRSIAASCGKYYTQVVDTKTNCKNNYALVDGGMNHLVYFGQHMAMSLPPFTVYGRENEECVENVTICGSLCSMNDIVVKQAFLPKLHTGDILCFHNTGAYCVTEGISLFLSRDLPKVYIKTDDGEYKLVRDRIQTSQFNYPKY